jgi:hypothetical protein
MCVGVFRAVPRRVLVEVVFDVGGDAGVDVVVAAM